MIQNCHGIPCFHFWFLFRNKGKRYQLDENDFRGCYCKFFSKVSSRNDVESSFSNITRHFDNLQLKILKTWINIGVEPAARFLTYYSMLLFLSDKPSF